MINVLTKNSGAYGHSFCGHSIQPDFGKRIVSWPHLSLFHDIKTLKAMCSSSKHCVQVIEMGQICKEHLGVQKFQGRFEVDLQKDGRTYTLMFSCLKEAAKAFDKASYKLRGALAKTNFKLTDEEMTEVEGMDWEDLLLHLQLQNLQTSPSGLGFPGVSYKTEEKSWQVTIKHEKEAYVGLFSTMTEATKVYDLAACKLYGRNTILSQPLSLRERKEVMDMDWDTLTAKIGLKVRPRRIRRSSGCHGVRLQPAGNWHASFSHKGHNFYLGTFDSKTAAAKAHDLFAFKVLGETAKLNSDLLSEEKEFLSTISVLNLRIHLASQAILAPKILHLGARGARMVQGQWEVCIENSRKDRIYTSSVSTEQAALRVHDLAVYKLHNELGRTYTDLTKTERQQVESQDWKSLVSKLALHQMPSYRGVNRLVSGLWQSYIRHGGAYLPVGTFDSAETAAQASDMCTYKLLQDNAILNFPLTDRQKQEVDALDWGTLISNLRKKQQPSPVLKELGCAADISYSSIARNKKWMFVLCQQQLVHQQLIRRAPKVGRQLVVGNPVLAAQFSHFNRRADGSPMLVEEVMEGYNTPLLWECGCGNNVLKAPMGLLKTQQIVCKMPGCTVIPQIPRRLRTKKSSSDSNSAVTA